MQYRRWRRDKPDGKQQLMDEYDDYNCLKDHDQDEYDDHDNYDFK